MKEKIEITIGGDNEKSLKVDYHDLGSILVTGKVGSGKTEFIQNIAIELAKYNSENIRFVVLDPIGVEYDGFEKLPHLNEQCIFRDVPLTRYLIMALYTEMERRRDKCLKEKTEYAECKDMPMIITFFNEVMGYFVLYREDVDKYLKPLIENGAQYGISFVVETWKSSILPSELIKCFTTKVCFPLEDEEYLNEIICKDMPRLKKTGDFVITNNVIGQNVVMHNYYLTSREKEKRIGAATKERFRKEIKNAFIEQPLFKEVVEFVAETQQASTIAIRRKFCIGYPNASLMVDMMESFGLISDIDPKNNNNRTVYIDKEWVRKLVKSDTEKD